MNGRPDRVLRVDKETLTSVQEAKVILTRRRERFVTLGEAVRVAVEDWLKANPY